MNRELPRPTDNAFLGASLHGQAMEPNYAGALSFLRRRYSRDLAGVDAVVWGVPLDTTVSNRPGTRFGPRAIRAASAILDGDPVYPFAFDPFATLAVVDYGDCVWDYGLPETVPEEIERQAAEILESGAQLVSLGGDHFITYPLLRAHAARHGPLALVQFDSHQDTWPDDRRRMDHGTMIARAVAEGLIRPERSIQVGIRAHSPTHHGLGIVFAAEVPDLGVASVVRRILERVGDAKAYLTFDIDALDPAFAPGTGTPVCGGLSTREALGMVRGIGSLDFVGMDVVEVSPPYDHAEVTALTAATIAQCYLCLLAARCGATPATELLP
ncbi:MAG: agmatinase [Pseudomonadota bacterium]|nr:agmatinase [Pseudomonadota bacterium]